MKSSYEYYVTPEDYEVAAKHGVSRKLLEHRLRNLGWDKDFAMTESRRKASEWAKVKEIALKNHIGRTTFKGRRQRGWSLIQSITKPPLSREKTLKRENDCNRALTDDHIQKSTESGQRYSTVYDRIKKFKWNIE
ncbi:hypothetical protein, partial [Bacillus thuringiensis]|uniref:hypothetical protein n=1 Tax=Bacillus thuringiensis TaxID=1428 RepID=UPI002840F286